MDTMGDLLSRASSQTVDYGVECKLASTRGGIDEMAELVCLAARQLQASDDHHATSSTRACI
jgi:hypothetical protein